MNCRESKIESRGLVGFEDKIYQFEKKLFNNYNRNYLEKEDYLKILNEINKALDDDIVLEVRNIHNEVMVLSQELLYDCPEEVLIKNKASLKSSLHYQWSCSGELFSEGFSKESVTWLIEGTKSSDFKYAEYRFAIIYSMINYIGLHVIN
ncbi:hypothetical protein [Marinigracilibium pacificum]|uniref:Uncharacterized protein n=1 Tax=Marinigracilibium pacificum TaxID=2729599 RepID=A0A848J3N6_9BACT|nr:hypothetical protein [Marinigracilibium pacificum]NMM50341.1 hypothetical protein [Marinigracilibium pacificum]